MISQRCPYFCIFLLISLYLILDINFPDLENSEQIFDSHISQTFIHLFGGEEKQVMDNLTDGVVMATPRKRDIEPETGASVANKNLKTAEIKKTTSKCFVFY